MASALSASRVWTETLLSAIALRANSITSLIASLRPKHSFRCGAFLMLSRIRKAPQRKECFGLNEAITSLIASLRPKHSFRCGAFRMRDNIRKAPQRKECFGLNEAINEVIELARSAIADNRVSVQTRLAERALAIHGDGVQLQQ